MTQKAQYPISETAKAFAERHMTADEAAEEVRHLAAEGHKADTNPADKGNPLHAVGKFADEEHPGADRLARALIDAGAEIEGENAHGQMPLHMAIQWGDSQKVAIALCAALIDAGADPNRLSGQWRPRTPLATAIMDANDRFAPSLERTEMVRMLLAKGADSDKRSLHEDGQEGGSAIELAVREGQAQVFAEIVESGTHLDQEWLRTIAENPRAREGRDAIVELLDRARERPTR